MVRQPAADQAVKMIPELITLNAPARPCMNGAPAVKNASARRAINILVREPDMQVVKVIAATTNIKNVNVPVDTHGTLLPEPAPAAVLINTLVRAATSPAGQVRLAVVNIPPANARPDILGTHQAGCASATELIGAL